MKSWNRTASHLTGYSAKEVKGRYLHKIPFFIDGKSIAEMIKDVSEKKISLKERILVESKKGEKRVLSLSISPLQNRDQQCIGTLFIGHDITTNLELHKFLVYGNSYLLCEKDAAKSFSLLMDMLDESTHGLFVSRIHSTPFEKKYAMENLHVVGIGSALDNSTYMVQNLSQLKDEIVTFFESYKNCVVLLDGAHFFFTMGSFDEFARWLFEITELVYFEEGFVIFTC